MIYNSYNKFHLGDNTYHLHLLRKLCDVNGGIYNHYVLDQYIPELRQQIIGYENKINLYGIDSCPIFAQNSWIATDGFFYNDPEFFNYNEMYIRFFDYYCSRIGVPNPCTDVVFEYEEIKLRNDLMSGGYDILLVNSIAHSGQFDCGDHEMLNLANQLSSKYSIITTQKLGDYPCTRDLKYSLVDIAALAINCKYLVSIFTSPFVMSINKWSNFEKVFTLDKFNSYRLPNFFRVQSPQNFDIITRELL